MAAFLRLPGGTSDIGELVEALLVASEARADAAPDLALRWRWLADDIGDALDLLPPPKEATP